jgi:hypothetical protein
LPAYCPAPRSISTTSSRRPTVVRMAYPIGRRHRRLPQELCAPRLYRTDLYRAGSRRHRCEERRCRRRPHSEPLHRDSNGGQCRRTIMPEYSAGWPASRFPVVPLRRFIWTTKPSIKRLHADAG